ncbi:flagellar hook-length control protein FliK [Duganella sp. CT11-72]|uniref:flagellar hook-length control protein FliK n=1 Tax=Duganella sp. CT11-72 TaxID=3243052 RepID=UPI0039B073DC
MLPRLDAATVTPLTPADGVGAGVAIGDGRQAAFQRALQGLVGQTVTAEVMSRLKDGSYLVKVADNAVRMMLPPGTEVGADVPLTVLSANPRPTFQVGNGTPGGSATLVYADTGAAGGDPAAPLPSQGSAVYVPGSGKPSAAAPPGQPGAAPGTPAGAGPESAAGGDPALPGQAKPAVAAPDNPATPAGARPGPPTGADAAGAAPPGPPARPATAAGAAAGAPAAYPAALPTPAAGQAAAATALAAGAAGSAVPADAVKPQSLAATLLGKAPLTPSNELPDLDPNTPLPTLSSTARVLTTVLGTAQAGQSAQLALVGKTALFGNAAPDAGQLAQKLHDTISQSGLFYESHVTEWVKGERTLPELMREPQMQRLMQGGESAARAAASGPDLTAAQLINQQLHTQEQGRVQWNGQAWPGQAMQWEIRREQREGRKDDGGGGGEAEPEQVWRSGVRFRFPMLGAVSASVTLVGGQVHIQVQADSDDTATTLRAYAGRLEGAMEAAGAPLSSLTISQEARDDG